MLQNPSLQVLASAHLPATVAPSVSLPHNDVDYSAAEYGHLAGLPAARTLQLPSPEQELSHAEAMTLALQAARQGIRGANPSSAPSSLTRTGACCTWATTEAQAPRTPKPTPSPPPEPREPTSPAPACT